MAALGYVYRRMGDQMEAGVEQDMMYNKAEQNFLKALKDSPKLMDEDSESWWGSLGGLYRRRGQIKQAIQAYERCAEVTPHSSYPFSNLALLYMQTHDREKMLKTYQRVEKLAEVDNYWAYADLIVARLALGKVKETEDILETALETAPPDSPYTLESLLDTLSRLHQAVEPDKRPSIERIMAQIRHFRAQRQSQLTADM
jgi:tetratricopeptide (TPR) repeat protein